MAIHPQKAVEKLGLDWPAAPEALADYVPSREGGHVLHVSGQLPLREGRLVTTGKVGGAVDLALAIECAQQCMLNAMAIIDAAVDGDYRHRFGHLLRLGVFVASAPDFVEQHLVANGASELAGAIYGERGQHARAAVGVASLPKDAPVEIEVTVQLPPPDRDTD